MKIKNLLVGCDVEVFLTQNSKPVSAKEYFENRIDINGFSFFNDNLLLEFNIPPSSNANEFSSRIKNAIGFIKTCIPEEINIKISAYEKIPYSELVKKEAMESGCQPYNNIYIGENLVSDITSVNFRTGSGHIHIGYDNPSIETSLNIVRGIDYIISRQIIKKDKRSYKRMRLYGKMGDYRLKPYGVEARSPSNYWVRNPKNLFNSVLKIVDMINKGYDFSIHDEELININNLCAEYSVM